MRRVLAAVSSAALVIALGAAGYLMIRHIHLINTRKIEIENIDFTIDKDNDGINDLDDIVQGARMEVINRTRYKNKYYGGGYPPDSEGVCTDVIWRALKNAGYDFKSMIDKDIEEAPQDYPLPGGKRDPNIDFRRVKNDFVFFKKYALSLTLEVKQGDIENLKEWQRGDIVTLNSGHIAVISDKRRRDGVPYIIHNAYIRAKEEDNLVKWRNKITGHFRFPKEEQ